MVDVSKQAKVSPSTVSLYLRRPDEVSQRIGERIAIAIDELGYVPSFIAGGLAAASSRVVSIIVPSMRNAFFSETINLVESQLARHNLQALVGHTDYDLDRETALVRASLSWSPAGIILTGMDHSPVTSQLLRKSNVPVIEMWDIGTDPIDIAIGFSHFEVGRAQARHLYSRGCSRVAFFGARVQDDTRAARRRDGFVQEISERGGVAHVLLDPRPASTTSGVEMLATMIAQGIEVDGIVCSNDALGLGVLFEAHRRHIRVPHDIKVMGFGDMEFGANCTPPMTTVRLPTEAISRHSVDMILTAGSDRSRAERIIDLQFQIVPRQSA